MKVKRLRLVLSAILTVALSGAIHAEGRPASSGGLQAKIEYCSYCHGASGQGYRAYYTMPRLAGQTTEYFINQLRDYDDRRRSNAIMYGVSHNLSPGVRAALARHFANLNPRPIGHGAGDLVAAGKKIYQEGVPDDNVPACAACHGTDAHGYGQNPRLAGQLPSYVQKTLANWGQERAHGSAAPEPASIMQPVTRRLSKSQAAAVAAYLSSLR
jgi:cytochrome c553